MDTGYVVNLNVLLKKLNGHLGEKGDIPSNQRDVRNIDAIFRGVKKALSEYLFGEGLMLASIHHTIQLAQEFELSDVAIQDWTMLKSASLCQNYN